MNLFLQENATEAQKRNHELAKIVDGIIDRKVVKQTVMTSVYGVTFIGARKQIQARLREKFQAAKADGMLDKDEEQVSCSVSSLDKESPVYCIGVSHGGLLYRDFLCIIRMCMRRHGMWRL